jgi:hypothetical protein
LHWETQGHQIRNVQMQKCAMCNDVYNNVRTQKSKTLYMRGVLCVPCNV